MAQDAKPLSDLVAQGWEVVGYMGQNFDMPEYSVLLRRQRQHKVLMIRGKAFGGGLNVKELDI